jgi:hypothetical protein
VALGGDGTVGRLQVTVVNIPVLQQAFGTVGLSAGTGLRCIAIASSVLWLRELGKLMARSSLTRVGSSSPGEPVVWSSRWASSERAPATLWPTRARLFRCGFVTE